MITQAAEYSLRAAVCLASRRGEAMTTQQIAARAGVPAGYLAKVLQVLARAGVVDSQRGANGGFVLKRPAAEVTLLDIVSVVDRSRRIRECPLGLVHEGGGLCPLHRRLDHLAETAEEVLRSTTLAQLLGESGDILLCAKECKEVGRD